MFGKHHLIGLSPNKTVEGFVGGFFFNVIVTYVVTVWLLKSNFWSCAPDHFNYDFFENYQCEQVDPIYIDQEYELLFGLKITMPPAVLYTVIFAGYASLVAPFVGFFASGFKRAVG